jgi:tetratricopeptide (TPR) repeat protein
MFFKTLNILLALFLLGLFFIAGQNVIQTFRVADMAALNNLVPQPLSYFRDLNTGRAVLDKDKIRVYADYYEHLIKVFPGLWDAYSMLGYCYHYLNDDPRAIRYLTTAIKGYPDYFWDYYDLAAIYINESRYQEALSALHKALDLPPMTSLKRTFTSQFVFLPLIGTGDKGALSYSAIHLGEAYKSSFIIAQILSRTESSTTARGMMKRIKPELYAF